MADSSTPLILPRYNSSSKALPSPDKSPGLPQLLQALLVSLAWSFDAQQTFISVFTDADPTWHCTTSHCSSAAADRCDLPAGSWAWDRPKHASTVSDWGLECLSRALIGLPSSSYFLGCLAGGFFLSTLADSWLGRKNMLLLSCALMSVSGGLAAISPNIWAYVALRFVCGFGRAAIGTCALVLTTEIVREEWRGRIGVAGFFCFTLGFLSLPAMAYVGRGLSWRYLYLWTSVPSLCYTVLVYFLVPESPRWILGHRQENDAFLSMRILWEKKWALRRLIVIMTVGFGIGTVYYGMPLNVGNLGSDLYTSVTLNALAELPSSLVTLFLVGSLDRRNSSLAFTTASGVCGILCSFATGEGFRITTEVMSFFCACTAFNVVLIYSVELFPTCMRNSAISMVRQAVVLGGVFAPVLVAAGRKRRFLSFGVYGLLIGGCGFCVAWLPETRGRGISDTMEEEEIKQIN